MSDDDDSNAKADKTAATAKQIEMSMVTPSSMTDLVTYLISSRNPDGSAKEQGTPMIWGAPGIGKSEMCYQMADKWGMRVVALHLPQFDPVDLKGIPIREPDGRVRWVASSYLPQFEDHYVTAEDAKAGEWDFQHQWPEAKQIMVHVIDHDGNTIVRHNDQMNGEQAHDKIRVTIGHNSGLVTVTGTIEEGMRILVVDKALIFLDEISTAVAEVQNAALQLVLEKRVGEYNVPPFTPMLAAGNREDDGAFVHQMSAPLANRFMHIRLLHNVDDWIEWALDNRVEPSVIGYIKWRGEHLFHYNPDLLTNGDYGFASPRSWTKLSNQMGFYDRLTPQQCAALVSGFIGTGIGHQFIAFRRVKDDLPTPEDIFTGRVDPVNDERMKRQDIGAKYAMAVALCYGLKEWHSKHFREEFEADDDLSRQPQEWRDAADAFCRFVHHQLGSELTTLCIKIVSRTLEISFTHLRDEDFLWFAKKYQKVIRKTA